MTDTIQAETDGQAQVQKLVSMIRHDRCTDAYAKGCASSQLYMMAEDTTANIVIAWGEAQQHSLA